MLSFRLVARAATLILCALVTGATIAPAAESAAPSVAVDCSKATAVMQAMPTGDTMKTPEPSLDVDANFRTAMMGMIGHETSMAQMEVRCGKDPATRALAKKMLNNLGLSGEQLQTLIRQASP